MKDNIIFSLLGVSLLMLGATGRDIITDFGAVKFILVSLADCFMLARLIYKAEG
jgi:hypothetical protein